MSSIQVGITIGQVDGDSVGTQKAFSEFEDFCTVSESVKQGIPVGIGITVRTGEPCTLDCRRTTMTRTAGAETPEKLVHLFTERAREKDVDGLVALYEPDAVLAVGRPIATGREEIRNFYTDLLARKTDFPAFEPMQPIFCGELALTVTITGKGRSSVEISRRQPDGNWLWVIDQLKVVSLEE